jgi:hypothetical protein
MQLCRPKLKLNILSQLLRARWIKKKIGKRMYLSKKEIFDKLVLIQIVSIT